MYIVYIDRVKYKGPRGRAIYKKTYRFYEG